MLGITGPAAYEEVLSEVRRVLPNQHTPDPKIDLIPAQGVKLTPRHYAYLKISEGCNHRCRFCIIPSLRGDLVSRPIGEVMREAEQLVRSGVKELLVISQDTSAYGVDLKYKTDFWEGRPLKTNMQSLATALGDLGAWVRMHYVRVGCFKYSAVEGATANALENPVPEGIKEERWHRFMALQQEISAERLKQKVGQSIDVMIDEIGPDVAVGRSKGDAPEIDGVVYVSDAANLKLGDIVNRQVVDADDYDLWTA